MTHSKQIILVVSNEPWNDLWYSKKHYAWALSEMGHRVFFVNPSPHWRLSNLVKRKHQLSYVNANLIILSYYNLLPVIRPLLKFCVWINDRVAEYGIRKYTAESVPLVWNFDPNRFAFNFNNSKKIYHVVDPYMHLVLDSEISKRSDLVVLVSEKYREYYQKYNNNLLIVPHGVPTILNISPSLPSLKYAVLIGNIGNDLNFQLLSSITEIGHCVKIAGNVRPLYRHNFEIWQSIISKPNVDFLGKMDADEIAALLANATMGLVVYEFQAELHIDSRSPLKILNYVSANLPVLSSCHPDLNELTGKGVYHLPNEESFLEHFKMAFNRGLIIDGLAYTQYVRMHSYPHLIAKIFQNLKQS